MNIPDPVEIEFDGLAKRVKYLEELLAVDESDCMKAKENEREEEEK